MTTGSDWQSKFYPRYYNRILCFQVLDTYHFERLVIHDVCITPDGQRLIGFGTLLSSGAGLKPCKCRAEKQIIGACIGPYRVCCHVR
jgi:hypothetical protein